MTTAQTVKTEFVIAASGVRFAYRRFGLQSSVPFVLHIHFRANMDLWDPLFVNTLANSREVIIFDQAGVGRSTGEVPTTYQGWADDLISFVRALKIEQIDLLGFSMGGRAVQYVALTVPGMVRHLVIAGSSSSAPHVGAQLRGTVYPRESAGPDEIGHLKRAVTVEEGRYALWFSFFRHDDKGRNDFDGYWDRVGQRHAEPLMLQLLDRDVGASRQWEAAVYDAIPDAAPNPSKAFHRLRELDMPVLVANGDDDLLIPTSKSWELMKQINNAQLIIYPLSGHGFIWQYAQQFAEDVNRFLDDVLIQRQVC